MEIDPYCNCAIVSEATRGFVSDSWTFLSYCVTNLLRMILKYRLQFVAFSQHNALQGRIQCLSVRCQCQSSGRTRSSSVVTLARPSVSSSLQITNRSFRYASPYLRNQLPSSFRQLHSVHSPPGSPYPAHITSSQLPPSLSPSITPSTFHSRLISFTNPFLHSHSYSF